MTIFSSANPGAYRYPFPAFPDGWFAIAFSEDLKPGQILSLHRLGRDIVLYRTEQGQAIAVDAYCPHVGAHLGEGRVLGEELQCVFHHWRYGPDGRCAHAPRAKRTPAVSLDSYPLRERNSLLFIWVHATGAAPDYEIDPIPELENGSYRRVRRHDWLVRSHPQEMMENSVDVTHFEAVHRWRAKSIDWQCEGPRYWMRIAVDNAGEGYQSATAANADDVVSTNVGPGFSYTRFTGSLNAISLNIMTPTEAGMVWNPQAFWVAPAIDEAMAQGWAQGFLDDYADDIPIWERKIYREKPALSDADGAFARYRRWYGQFYTDRHPGA
ncbi:MAG TPA: Rieske 2Fe-2S domain-containing protein [Spongiibacteraceae bacterium]|nr:Rieske 2Fe-2S domain-containing protein [Spongiibacteraceae bacterium]